MTYRELKTSLSVLTEEQLDQTVGVVDADHDVVLQPDELLILKEDIYWEHHGSKIGTYKDLEEYFHSEPSWDEYIDDLIKIPAGTVTLE